MTNSKAVTSVRGRVDSADNKLALHVVRGPGRPLLLASGPQESGKPIRVRIQYGENASKYIEIHVWSPKLCDCAHAYALVRTQAGSAKRYWAPPAIMKVRITRLRTEEVAGAQSLTSQDRGLQ